MDFNTAYRKVQITQSAYNTVNSVFTKVKARMVWTVTVEETDDIYWPLLAEIDNLSTPKTRRALAVKTRYDNETKKNSLTVGINAGKTHSFVLNGHKITVSIDTADGIDNDEKSISGMMNLIKEKNLTLTATTQAGQMAVLDYIMELSRNRTGAFPTIWTMSHYGSFQRRRDLPQRDMDTIVLREGQAERLTDDLGTFLESESRYTELGMPWHRGYLFHGPPGTGKTSLVKGLAQHFGLDVYCLQLGDAMKDSNLISLVSDIAPRSVVLIEDIDVHASSISREEKSGGSQASLAALLNALDGVTTPHGMIVMMTTNDIDALDPALLRTGRVDVQELIDNADAHQVKALFSNFYARELVGEPAMSDHSMSWYCELFKRYMFDADGAEAAILASK